MFVDLGPTWYWPRTQPAMANLVAELGLTAFPQFDDGTTWVLTDPNEKPQKLENQTIHEGALRVDGGMARVTEAIASGLGPGRVALSHVLDGLVDRGSHVQILLRTPDGEVERHARRVVLAMPPRLIEEHILFSPALPDEVQSALLASTTWMARQAKAVVVYGDSRDFRSRVGSGDAFVHHEQAVLSEVFDAGSMDGRVAALGGFLALSPAERARFREGMEMLVTSQFVQLFGLAFEKGTMHYQDWAAEPFTCGSLDRREDAAPAHPQGVNPLLRSELWGGKLWFAGAEFAASQAGFMEGALIDAGRVVEQLVQAGGARQRFGIQQVPVKT